jgi:Fe-S cluster assembly iron-binding protein IscA
MISITKSAAEKITEAVNQQDIEGKSLRVGVFPGGCSGGYQ